MGKTEFINGIIAQMTIEQKIGQCVVVGMSGTQITNDLREAIIQYHCGGIRLSPFTRIFRYFSDSQAKPQELGPDYTPSRQKLHKPGPPPYLSPEEFAARLNELRDLAATREPAIPLHMAIDQEGDTSKDFSRGGVVRYPSNMGMVASGDPELAYRIARGIARQMKASGLDMIHSPVVDVNINPQNPEIGHRAFSDDPQVVAEYAAAMVRGFKEEKVIAAAKHFPGRGDSVTDAHHACPCLDVDLKRFYEVELYPYRKLIEAGVDAIMVAHGMYPRIDPDFISTVSRKIVTGLLREKLGFQGLITTDSMTMGALIDRYGIGDSCAMALAAGADLILMKAENSWRGEMFYTIRKYVADGRISRAELEEKVRRILALKYDYGMFDHMGKVDAVQAGAAFREPIVVETAKEAARRAILIAKDEPKALPLRKDRKILLINQQNSIKSPNDSFDHPALFQELLETELPELQTYETNFGWNADDEAEVLRFVAENQFELILCTHFYDRTEKPHEYVKTLIDRGYPVVLITNTPYCIEGIGGMIPEAPTIILNMNLTPEGYRITRDVLLNRVQPEGSWPLANYNPFNL